MVEGAVRLCPGLFSHSNFYPHTYILSKHPLSMEQQHMVVLLIVAIGMSFIIGNAFGQAGAFNSNLPNHPLQQIRTTPSSSTSVDADGDGIIDQAAGIPITVTTLDFTGDGEMTCGGKTAIGGGCDCQSKNITRNTPVILSGNSEGWACSCESGSDGRLTLLCTN